MVDCRMAYERTREQRAARHAAHVWEANTFCLHVTGRRGPTQQCASSAMFAKLARGWQVCRSFRFTC
jgi:hypothetical protein